MTNVHSPDASRSLIDVEAWRTFERSAPGLARRLLLLGAVAAAQSLLLLPVVLLIRHAVDVAMPAGNIGLLVGIGAAIFGIRFLNGGISLWLRVAHVRVIKAAILRLREDLLARLYRLSRAAYGRLDWNTTHARIVVDTDRLDNMSHAMVSRMLPALFSAVALLAVLAYLDLRLLLVTLAMAPMLLLVTRLTGRAVQRRVFEFQRAFERFSKGMLFVLQHMDLTRVQSFEDREIARRIGEMRKLRETSESMAFIYSLHSQLQSVLVSLCGAVILVLGGIAVATQHMTLGDFLSFWVAAGLLNGHVGTVLNAFPEVIAGNESMTTLHRFAHGDEPEPYHGREHVAFSGRITLEDVGFGYGGSPVLDEANLEIEPGTTLAIVGPNGAGKSTVLYLILGFYRPERGKLRADGVPYDRLDMKELRRGIGVVMQHPAFFAGTILENITYGNPEASRADVMRAAGLAFADEFIRKLPLGYDTPIGEEGMLLSGGEVQRIAIARALLRRPRLLVLDEPTNHLEHAVIRRLMQNLTTLDDRPAVLVISHDREVLHDMDRVVRIADGALVTATPIPLPQAAGRSGGAS